MNFNIKEIFTAFMVLFAVIDIVGNIPIIIDLRKKAGHIQSEKASVIAGVIMIIFLFIGESILKLVGIDVHSFAVAGAFILLFIALEMILGITLYKQEEGSSLNATVFPLAFPLIAGPGSLTTLLSLRSEFHTENIILAVIINVLLIFIVLKTSAKIERLIGQNGINFSKAYATASVCAPSRAAFLTGNYHHRYGFEFLPDLFNYSPRVRKADCKRFGHQDNFKMWYEKDVPINQRGLDPYVNTIGDYLKKMGYQTSVIGKWHMGTHPKFRPESYGFDYHYGITGAASLYAPIGKENIVESKHTWDFADFITWQVSKYYTFENGKNSIPKKSEYLTDVFTKKAVNYIKENKEIELIPRVGNHNILLGNINGYEEKFKKLKLFYSEGVKQTGWNNYKEINLKFKDQIVCVKK